MSQAGMALAGLKVIDCATLFAGPLIGTFMADFGADVIKIEHPTGDALRKTGLKKDGVPLWWKVSARNKRSITLNFSQPEGQALLKQLVAGADVLIENFRPGTMERWGLGWEVLSQVNPRLIMVRTTGFGQTGPYRHRPGFGTLAEAMSGFAHITGAPDGPPTLPPFGLADNIAALYGTNAVMFALYERDAGGSGRGQWIDLSIIEPIFAVMGYQSTAYDQLGVIQQRNGNRSVNNAPRNTYQTREGRWVAISCSTPSIAERVLRLIGGQDLVDDPRFRAAHDRVANVEELDRIVGNWIGQRSLQEVLEAFEREEGAIAPVYDIGQIMADPQFLAREAVTEVADAELGRLKMPNVFPRLSRTPGRIAHAGPKLGEHNAEVYGGLGLTLEAQSDLRARGVI